MLVSLSLLFHFKVLVLQEVMRVKRVRVWVKDLVLVHVVLLELHVLNSTLSSKANTSIMLETRELVIESIEFGHLIL